MTRKLIIFGSAFALLILVAGAIVAGSTSTMAQKGQFSHIYAQQDSDSDVVAVVQGKDIVRQDVRIPAEKHRTMDPSLTQDEAKQKGIRIMVTKRVIEAEVERRNLVPTESEVEDFRRATKEACRGPDGQDCRDIIEETGYTFDEYWRVTLPEYQKDLGKIRLFQAVYYELGIPSDADNEELIRTEEDFTAQLRRQATITWNDADLKRLYEEAVAE